MVLVHDEVLVLEGRSVRRTVLDQAAKCAALQIIDASDVIFVVKSERVSHQDEMHLFVVLHLNRVDAVDSRDERFFVLF